jgi:hypothetical protein
MLTCDVGHDQRPRNCATLKESPGNYGFGTAARHMAEKMKVASAGMYGQNIFIPFAFDPAVLAGPVNVTEPAWTATPNADDLNATFPKSQNGVNDVRVVLGCTIGAGGSLDGCTVAQETPAGQGYGDGALALASKFKVGLWSVDGAPTVGARIKLPIHYKLKQVAAAPTSGN